MAIEPKGAGRPAPDRRRDVEVLAAALFPELFKQFAGAKTPAGIAREAVRLAREFYAVCDEPTPRA